MDKNEQVGSTHECFSDLLHALGPEVLIEIACRALGIAVHPEARARYVNPRIEIAGLSKAARTFAVDLVYTLESGESVVELWIFEIQLSWSALKRRRWALFLSAYENEFDVDGRLVVYCPEPELHQRIREKAIPGCRATPLLLDRDHFERIADIEQARRQPRLAILGCLFHAQEPAPLASQLEVFRAAWMAIQGLPSREAQRYGVLVMDVVAKHVVDQGIEELRESGELDEDLTELVSDTARKGYTFNTGREEGREQGREEGREEGREQGREEGRRAQLRTSILDMLEVRGFVLTLMQRRRVASCDSLATLQRWYAAAKVAAANQSVDELLADD